jgi:hypothetical protein
MSDQNKSSKKIEEQTVKAKKRPTILTILLVLLSILFVLSTLLTLIGYDIWRVAFDPPLVKQILADEFIESDLAPRILEDMSIRRTRARIEQGEALSGVDEPDIQLLVSFVRFEDWAAIKDLIVTDDFITHLISVSVDGLYTWIDSPDPLPSFVWGMSPLKDRLVGQEGKDAIMIAYHALPACTPEEVDDFLSRLAAMPPGVEVLYNLCQFPDPYREDQIDDYVNALIDVNANVPPEYDFNQMLGSMPGGSASTALVKSLLRGMRFLGQWGWILPLVLLGLIAAVGVRTLKDAGNWLGLPMAVSGLLTIGLYFLTRTSLGGFVAARLGAEMSPLLRTELSASLGRLSIFFFQPLLIEGAILLGIGLVLFVLGMIMKKKPAQVSP